MVVFSFFLVRKNIQVFAKGKSLQTFSDEELQQKIFRGIIYI